MCVLTVASLLKKLKLERTPCHKIDIIISLFGSTDRLKGCLLVISFDIIPNVQ